MYIIVAVQREQSALEELAGEESAIIDYFIVDVIDGIAKLDDSICVCYQPHQAVHIRDLLNGETAAINTTLLRLTEGEPDAKCDGKGTIKGLRGHPSRNGSKPPDNDLGSV